MFSVNAMNFEVFNLAWLLQLSFHASPISSIQNLAVNGVVVFVDVVVADHELGRLLLRPRSKELHRRWRVCGALPCWRHSTVRFLLHMIC